MQVLSREPNGRKAHRGEEPAIGPASPRSTQKPSSRKEEEEDKM